MASAGPTFTVAATPDNVVYLWGSWADGGQVAATTHPQPQAAQAEVQALDGSTVPKELLA